MLAVKFLVVVGNHGIKIVPLRLKPNGTAVVVVNVTRRNPPVDCPGKEYGAVPVGRRVWRGICKVACGWFRYRVTMMLGIR